jgi:hypothetical protein
MSLIDRVSSGLDQISKRAVQAIDESKLRLELGGVRRRKDAAARDLGYLTYRRSKGEVIAEGDSEFLIRRIAKAEEEAAKLEAQIAAVRGAGAPTASAPTEGPATESQEPTAESQEPTAESQEPRAEG